LPHRSHGSKNVVRSAPVSLRLPPHVTGKAAWEDARSLVSCIEGLLGHYPRKRCFLASEPTNLARRAQGAWNAHGTTNQAWIIIARGTRPSLGMRKTGAGGSWPVDREACLIRVTRNQHDQRWRDRQIE
jgi:hypothetical protein